MEEIILISYFNDFIFCPISIYFHKLYGNVEKILYQDEEQINGTNAHSSIDNANYSTKKSILMGTNVYCQEYGVAGKIDLFDCEKGILIERKNLIKELYDGFIFQIYAQYFALVEMGYKVRKLRIHSLKDNKNYEIKLPYDDMEMFNRFKKLIKEMREFDINKFVQKNKNKCSKCIYEPSCDRSLKC